MSDSVFLLVDERVTADQAAAHAKRVVRVLRDCGWIVGEPSQDLALGGAADEPGPAARGYRSDQSFLTLHTRGVEVNAEPTSSLMYPHTSDEYACPHCRVASDETEFVSAIGEWASGAATPEVACPRCAKTSDVRHWVPTSRRGLRVVAGHVAICCWNWPPLDDADWQRKITDDLEAAFGYPFALGFGHI
jgi:hypothetical protein